ncbi:MAG: thioredoxin family protein [Bdellovibrionota bacterium]
MKNLLKTLTLSTALIGFCLSQNAFAKVNWQPYSSAALQNAEKQAKTVVLGFHKRGCPTCDTQDAALEKAGINNANILALRVERNDSSLENVYEKYGFNKRQWSALVALKNGKEIARLAPGTTNENQIQSFVSGLN